MKAIIKLQKTGYYITTDDGATFKDETGHGWFSRDIARQHARRLGVMYHDGNKTTIKEVVTGYES